MIDLDDLLDLLREMKRKDTKKDYISLIELLPKLKVMRPEWTDEEIRDGLNSLRNIRRIRITDNFQIRL